MADNVKLLDNIIKELRDFENSAETARSRAEAALAREMEGTARIRAWLVAANAGALLICFNTMLNGQICDWVAFRPLVLVFVLGLASAFFSVMAERRAHSVYRILMVGAEDVSTRASNQVGAFEAIRPTIVSGDEKKALETLQPVADAFDALRTTSRSLHKIDTGFWHAASGWLELASVAALACGLIWAVSDATFIQALCKSGAPVDAPSER